MNTLVVGLQFGDEGKGRVSAYLEKDHDWYVRFNGGPNAGHTVYRDGKKYALHQLPSGIVFGKKVALDAGMVIDLEKLVEECDTVGVKLSDLHISERVHLINKKHRDQDSNGSGVGSTKRGIAYAYADKVLRKGHRAKDYDSFDMLNLYSGLPPIEDGENALYESAQGIMLDVDYGCYPYVTSSSVLPSIAHKIDMRMGVMKAYTSRVGDGPPTVSEVPGLAKLGDEFGTTTGRPRKCYWLIEDDIDYAMSIVKPDQVVVTKLDILEKIGDIYVWRGGKMIKVASNTDEYKNYLTARWPQIKYFSESPDGDLIEA